MSNWTVLFKEEKPLSSPSRGGGHSPRPGLSPGSSPNRPPHQALALFLQAVCWVLDPHLSLLPETQCQKLQEESEQDITKTEKLKTVVKLAFTLKRGEYFEIIELMCLKLLLLLREAQSETHEELGIPCLDWLLSQSLSVCVEPGQEAGCLPSSSCLHKDPSSHPQWGTCPRDQSPSR